MYDSERNIIQIIDFGVAKSIANNNCDHSKFIPGTAEYIPQDSICSIAFDMYSCGIVLEKWYAHANIEMNANASDLRDKLKRTDIKARITDIEALNHPFFSTKKNITSKNLTNQKSKNNSSKSKVTKSQASITRKPLKSKQATSRSPYLLRSKDSKKT